MKKQIVSRASVSGGERAAARLDRDTWLHWRPSRGRQVAISMVDAFCASKSKEISALEQRIAMNVRTMR